MKMGEKFVNLADIEDFDELTNYQRLAKQIVEDVIEKATEEVAKQVQFEIKSTKFTSKRPASLALGNLTPSIQIDLVPSRTPTPEEQDNSVWIEQQQQVNKKKRKIRVKIIEEEDEEQLKEEDSKSSTAKETDKESSQNSNQKASSNESKVNGKTKKKTSVSWGTDNEDNGNKEIERQELKSTKFNLDNETNDKIEQKIVNNQISNGVKKKVNSIKFDSTNKTEIINRNEKINDQRKSSKTARFTDENSINWPNYDEQELKKVASNFVHQIIDEAKKEAENRLKPSTSKTSGLYIEDKSKPNYQPWSLARIRDILNRIMRSSCLCKKSSVTHSNTSGSIADHV